MVNSYSGLAISIITSFALVSLLLLRKRMKTGHNKGPRADLRADAIFASWFAGACILFSTIFVIVRYVARGYMDIVTLLATGVSILALFCSVLTRAAVVNTSADQIHSTSSVIGLYALYLLTTLSTGVLTIYLFTTVFSPE